jgi:hypothetical protein
VCVCVCVCVCVWLALEGIVAEAVVSKRDNIADNTTWTSKQCNILYTYTFYVISNDDDNMTTCILFNKQQSNNNVPAVQRQTFKHTHTCTRCVITTLCRHRLSTPRNLGSTPQKSLGTLRSYPVFPLPLSSYVLYTRFCLLLFWDFFLLFSRIYYILYTYNKYPDGH